MVSLVPRVSGEGTLEFTCVRSFVRPFVRPFVCHGLFSDSTEPFWLKIGIQYPYYLKENPKEGFFYLGPPSPFRAQIVFSIQILIYIELKLTLEGVRGGFIGPSR